jgi:hypothetical protein
LNLAELNSQQIQETEGGFISLVSLGLTCTASTAAAVICGSSAAGVTAGMTIYLTNLYKSLNYVNR